MARKKPLDDASLGILLKGYRRPSLGAEALGRILSGAAAPPAQAGRRRAIGGWAWASMAAGLAIATGLGALAYLRLGELPSPVAVLGDRLPESTMTRGGSIKAEAEPLRLRSASETLVLEAGGRLRIDSDPWRRLRGASGNRYYLDSGKVYIEHAALPGRGDFSLVIPWGTISPLGTILSCEVAQGRADLICLDGKLRFVASGRRVYDINAGMVLSLRDDGRRITVEPETRSPAALGQSPSLTRAIPAPAAPKSKDALAKAWSRDLGEWPQEVYVEGPWAIVISTGEIQVLDRSDGASIARMGLPKPLGTYAVSGDSLIVYASAGLRRLSLPKLDEVWSTPTGNLAFTSFSLADGKVFLPSAEGRLYIHDLASGRLIDGIDAGIGLYGKPLVAGGRIIVSGLDRRLRAFDEGDHRKLWEYLSDEGLVNDEPRALGNAIVDYTKDGSLFALDARTGELRWKTAPGSAVAQAPLNWASRLVYRDARGARSVTAEGIVAEIAGGETGFGLGGDASLYLAGPLGIERLGPTGERVRLGDMPTLLLRVGNGAIATVDAAARLSLYRVGE